LGSSDSRSSKFHKLPTRQLGLGHKSSTVRESVAECKIVFL
jgi:hypothetical protein